MSNLLIEFFNFIKSINDNKQLLVDLAKNDFKQQYLGSFFGIVWAFVQPTITILIFWIAFQFAFKAADIDGVPFFLWLIAGMIPWFFFAESISTSTNSILEYSYLVKKVVFRVNLLPIIKILSAIPIHLFFTIFMTIIFFIYGFSFSLYWLQILYYLFAMIVLVLGLSFITSSIIVFFKDMGQIIVMALQIGFWYTPIMWSMNVIPKQYSFIFKFNPLLYIVEGYRNSIIYNIGFWEDWKYTGYYWCVTLIILVVGAIIFKRLRPHFADVLS